MKTVILAGGTGTRLQEETVLKPKPMVEIGGRPILWHIMKIYSYYDINEFVIALGYKGDCIKDYFSKFDVINKNITVYLSKTGHPGVYRHPCNEEMQSFGEDWTIDLIDTGQSSMTGGRLFRVRDYVNDTFLATYGDGLADINIKKLVEFHKDQGKLLTVTAVRPPARYGSIKFGDDNNILEFKEKPVGGEGWINGGFFVMQKEALYYIKDESESFEKEPMARLAEDHQIAAYKHYGFFQCMDTLRDKERLERLLESGQAPWKIWED